MPASTTGQQSSSKSHQPRPPRLRAACNQCNVAKVKCTGEKTGCSRCISLNTECIYMESRVGKVQGIRTKRKKTHPESAPSDDGVSSQSNSTQIQDDDEDETEGRDRNRADTLISSLPSPKAHFPDSADQIGLQPWSPGSWSWNNELFTLDSNITSRYTGETGVSGSSEASSAQLPTSITASSVCTRLTEVECENIGNLTTAAAIQSLPTPIFTPSTARPPTFTTTSALPQPTTETMSIQRQQALAARNSKCVLALANMVITLENYLVSNLKVLDLIIASVRTVAEEMRRILQYQRESRDDRCMFLSTTIMYQVIELLEIGANAVFEKGLAEQGHAGPAEDFEDFTPKLGFGALSTFNAEEQRSMKIHVLRKECQNMEEVLAQLLALAKVGPNAGAPPLSEAEMEDKTKCFTGLQIRLKNLICKANLAL
ncbi:hypothetical protein BU24DRAFT_213944 [Aaosphaeria arxii CBS 175.79]|uniref:Zn(2)-C6 fungal-type domain-containing protein n=1 Tax=Aaosphaeria arxii CBS 175.79 TaxID=1450172 RepID=A0A6A5XME5_9PLEO|nr:uncharacterized protein BU24DRAFT_213944 [Aaosphaeria arxii CBS 175.79]KAF2014415.1 hypothetical protein BU24DRAFT_213944 [Aaosphaeria arxii CBS 175.79]